MTNLQKELIEHLEEMIKLIQDPNRVLANLSAEEEEYIERIKQFAKKAKFWNPEIFLHVEYGNLQLVIANTNVVINLFDADSKKLESDFKDQLEEWNYMLKSGINDQSLIQLYP